MLAIITQELYLAAYPSARLYGPPQLNSAWFNCFTSSVERPGNYTPIHLAAPAFGGSSAAARWRVSCSESSITDMTQPGLIR